MREFLASVTDEDLIDPNPVPVIAIVLAKQSQLDAVDVSLINANPIQPKPLGVVNISLKDVGLIEEEP